MRHCCPEAQCLGEISSASWWGTPCILQCSLQKGVQREYLVNAACFVLHGYCPPIGVRHRLARLLLKQAEECLRKGIKNYECQNRQLYSAQRFRDSFIKPFRAGLSVVRTLCASA